VITRMWRGWSRSDQADRYEQHYRSEVVTTLRQIPGFRGARLLRRTIGEETEFVSLTLFDDLNAIRNFAGSDYETAVVAGEARSVLIRFDKRVCTTRPRLKPRVLRPAGCWSLCSRPGSRLSRLSVPGPVRAGA
jgi:heme-degrading monooxygenase HmoA